MPRFKPYAKIMDLETYANDQRIPFRFSYEPGAEGVGAQVVEVPISIVYRLFHLGRAYDFQAIKLIRPPGETRLDYIQTQQLAWELERIREIVNDPVAHHYLEGLLPFLQSQRGDTNRMLMIGGLTS